MGRRSTRSEDGTISQGPQDLPVKESGDVETRWWSETGEESMNRLR